MRNRSALICLLILAAATLPSPRPAPQRLATTTRRLRSQPVAPWKASLIRLGTTEWRVPTSASRPRMECSKFTLVRGIPSNQNFSIAKGDTLTITGSKKS